MEKEILIDVYNNVSLGVRKKAAELAGCSLPNFLSTNNERTIGKRINYLIQAQEEHVEDASQKLNNIKVHDYEVFRD